jgi:hypothetical protein
MALEPSMRWLVAWKARAATAARVGAALALLALQLAVAWLSKQLSRLHGSSGPQNPGRLAVGHNSVPLAGSARITAGLQEDTSCDHPKEWSAGMVVLSVPVEARRGMKEGSTN